MKPILKKVAVAVAAKQVEDTVVEKRRARKPSFGAKLLKLGLFGAVGVGVAYLVSSGKAQDLIDKVKGGSDSGSVDAGSNGHSSDVTFRSEDQPVSSPV